MSNLRYIAMLFFGILLSVFIIDDFNAVLSGNELSQSFGLRGLIQDFAGALGVLAFDIALVFGFIWYVKGSTRKSGGENGTDT